MSSNCTSTKHSLHTHRNIKNIRYTLFIIKNLHVVYTMFLPCTHILSAWCSQKMYSIQIFVSVGSPLRVKLLNTKGGRSANKFRKSANLRTLIIGQALRKWDTLPICDFRAQYLWFVDWNRPQVRKYTLSPLQIWQYFAEICEFAIAEWPQEFADLWFVDFLKS